MAAVSLSKGDGAVSMTRKAEHEALKAAFEKAGINGKLSTHSLHSERKIRSASDDALLASIGFFIAASSSQRLFSQNLDKRFRRYNPYSFIFHQV